MIQICKNCGAVNSEAVERCCFCDEPFAETQQYPAARAAAAAGASNSASPASSQSTEGNLAVKPANWRNELAGRVEAYRERRRKLLPDDSQVDFPFDDEKDAREEKPQETAVSSQREPLFTSEGAGPQMYRSLPVLRPASRADERVEIAVSQPNFDRCASESRPQAAGATSGEAIPVASLRLRKQAGMLDAMFLLLAYAGFLGLFHAFGGRLMLGKYDAIVGAATLILFYAQYFALFTAFGGETPGMWLRGLRVVSFDGSVPTPRQLLSRAFGYLISGGTAMLGFLWAMWDEDHLTWQDRISQTYLTTAPAAEQGEETGDELDDSDQAGDRPGVEWRRSSR